MTFDLSLIVRENIWKLEPYRCARDDYSTGILLDANENSLGSCLSAQYNDSHLERYPDPHQIEIKQRLAQLQSLPTTDYFFLGVGSDECIDLIIRIFCIPAKDYILICPPTYGMYSVCAQVNDINVLKVPLTQEFQLDVENLLVKMQDPLVKVVFLCSPGNPTGTLLDFNDVKRVLDYKQFKGIVVVDEAYIDFAKQQSLATLVDDYPQLIVIQTLSKSFGLAGIRLGVAISHKELIKVMNKTKAPYNISSLTAKAALSALEPVGISKMQSLVAKLNENRTILIEKLAKVPRTGKILGTNDANFVLIQILDKSGQPSNASALQLYKKLAEEHSIIVRYRGSELWCQGCLRITVGSIDEIESLIHKMTTEINLL